MWKIIEIRSVLRVALAQRAVRPWPRTTAETLSRVRAGHDTSDESLPRAVCSSADSGGCLACRDARWCCVPSRCCSASCCWCWNRTSEPFCLAAHQSLARFQQTACTICSALNLLKFNWITIGFNPAFLIWQKLGMWNTFSRMCVVF